MDRVKTKTGGDTSTWIYNIHSIVQWIQDFVDAHFKKFFIGYFKTSGVFYDGSENKLEGGAVKNGGNLDITVEAGMGSTDTGELIKLSTQGTKQITFPSDATYYLYLEFTQIDDSGSSYDIPRIPSAYSVIKGRTMDSYIIKFESSWGGTDTIKIATVVIASALVDSVTDSRIMATFFGIPAAGILWINDSYDVSGGDGFDKLGTTEDNYKVAVGKQTEANLMIEFIPEPPLGIRVYDLNPHHGQKDSAIGKLWLKWNWTNLIGAPDTGKIVDITSGDGDNLLDVGADDLIGYYLYSIDFVSTDNRYLIVDNGATATGTTSITLEDAYTGETFASKANIICGGDAIVVKRTNHVGEATPILEDEVLSTFDISHDISNEAIVNVQLGQNESIRMAAGRFGLQSLWTQMASIAGTDSTYDPDHGTSEPAPQPPVVYLDGTPDSTVMMNMKLPKLNLTLPTAASITLEATAAGFQITVLGWYASAYVDKVPHEYEVAYTTTGPNVDWTDPSTYTAIFSSNRIIPVPVAVRDLYYVSVRPIQNKQIVCDTGEEVHGEIVSGGSGVAPNDHPVIPSTPFKIFTFSGELASAVDTDWYPLTTPVSPAVGDAGSAAVSTDNLLSAVNNQVMAHRFGSILLDDSSKEFHITEGRVKNSQMQFRLEPLDGSSTPDTSGSNVARINTTATGRFIAELSKMTAEYVLTRAVINIKKALTVSPSDPAIINIKHNTTGGQIDLIEIENSNSYVEHGLDLEIFGEEPELNLLVNLFDPSGGAPNNECSVVGDISVYGRQKVTLVTETGGRGGRPWQDKYR